MSDLDHEPEWHKAVHRSAARDEAIVAIVLIVLIVIAILNH